MPLMSETGLKQEILKIQQQNEKTHEMLKTLTTEFRLALGQVLENQEIAKPIQDRVLEFTDEWFGTKFREIGFSQ